MADEPITETTRSWKAPSVFIAVLALILSLVTALISAYTAYRKDIHDRQAELSDLAEKLAELNVLTSDFNKLSRRGVLSKRGYSIARELGESARSPDLMVLAESLIKLYDYAAARKTMEQAINVSQDFFEKLPALRVLANFRIVYGDTEKDRELGDAYYQQAISLADNFKEMPAAEIAYTNGLTHQMWVRSWAKWNCNKSKVHLDQLQYYSNSTNEFNKTGLEHYFTAWQAALTHCVGNQLPFNFYPSIYPSDEPLDPPPPPPPPSGFLLSPEQDNLPSVRKATELGKPLIAPRPGRK